MHLTLALNNRLLFQPQINTDNAQMKSTFKHKEITEAIIGAAFEVQNGLRVEFIEKEYSVDLEPFLKVEFKRFVY